MNKLPPLLALSLLCGTAAADPEVVTSAVVGDRIEVTITGAQGARPEDFALRDATMPRGAAVHAVSVADYAHAGGAVAVAIVYQGGEVWIGNDQIVTTDEEGRFFGALAGVKGAVDQVVEHHFPMGSEAALISYEDGAQLRQPMGLVGHLSAASVGSQRDYYNRMGTDLARGIDLGFMALAQSRAPVKTLIVLGDGNDTNDEIAKAELADLKKRAAREHIHTFAVIYKGVLSNPSSVVTAFAPSARTVNTLDGMAAAVGAFLDRLTDQTFVSFEAPWTDGTEHAMIASVGAYDLDAEYLVAPYHAPSRFRWLGGYWQQLLAGFALVGLLALGLRLVGAHRGAKEL